MPSPGSERRLAAIMFTDIVGYTAALMAESEAKGLRARERHRELLAPLAERYNGLPIIGEAPNSFRDLEPRLLPLRPIVCIRA